MGRPAGERRGGAIKATKRRGKAERGPDLSTLYDRLVEQSPMKSAAAKETIALSVLAIVEQIARLRALARQGDLTGDEARSVPALASNLRRQLDTLGVLDMAQEEEDGFLG